MGYRPRRHCPSGASPVRAFNAECKQAVQELPTGEFDRGARIYAAPELRYRQPGSVTSQQAVRLTEVTMPPKKKLLQTPGKRRDRGSAKSRESGLSRRLNDLTEQIEIVVPEVTARVAALEHILLRKQLCTREDLFHAREFIRIQEG
jgi:hypothetical protein